MENVIDLGRELVFNVKLGDKVYPLREPTLKDVKSLKGNEADEDSFVQFVIALGMPEEVANNLGILKLKKLSESLVAPLTEKK